MYLIECSNQFYELSKKYAENNNNHSEAVKIDD
jgi:hypothetical protein